MLLSPFIFLMYLNGFSVCMFLLVVMHLVMMVLPLFQDSGLSTMAVTVTAAAIVPVLVAPPVAVGAATECYQQRLLQITKKKQLTARAILE